MVRRGMAVLLVSIALTGLAQAASGIAPTNLTIAARDGRVFGVLTGRPACRAGQPVELVVNGLQTATTTTDVRGRYSFSVALEVGAQVRTEFEGAIVGTHPEILVCRGSTSKTIVVRGTLPSGGSTGGPTGGVAGAGGAAPTGGEVAAAAGLGIVALATGLFLIVIARRSRTERSK